MLKRLVIIIFSGIVGIFSNPDFLMASDSVSITKLSESNIMETTSSSEEKVVVTTSENDANRTQSVATASVSASTSTSSTSATASKPASTPAPAPKPAPVYVAPSNNIQIAGRTLEIVDVADTGVDSGGHVNKYGDKFLYGHNSSAVFAGLYNMGVGSTFKMTYGGVTKTYQVKQVVVFEKNTSNGRLQLNGAGNYMFPVSKARHGGVDYDLSLMTCYGTMLPGRDATHRLVLFANAI